MEQQFDPAELDAGQVDKMTQALAFTFLTASGESPYAPSMDQVRRWATQLVACGVHQTDEFAKVLPVIPQWMQAAVSERVEVGERVDPAVVAPPMARVGRAPQVAADPPKRSRRKKK